MGSLASRSISHGKELSVGTDPLESKKVFHLHNDFRQRIELANARFISGKVLTVGIAERQGCERMEQHMPRAIRPSH